MLFACALERIDISGRKKQNKEETGQHSHMINIGRESNEAKRTRFVEIEERINLKHTRTRQTSRIRITKEKNR